MLNNLLTAPILFFFLGALARFLGVRIHIPKTLSRFLSLYLLLAIGLKGGMELSHYGIHRDVLGVLTSAVALASIIPLYTFFLLRLVFTLPNAAALAASFGSVSAVTFITAGHFIERQGISHHDYMVAALALMESPAIVLGILLYRLQAEGEEHDVHLGHLAKEALLNESNYLLIGSLLVGVLAGFSGSVKALMPFTHELFEGLLCLFLLDLGLLSARRFQELHGQKWLLMAFSIGIPLINATIGMGLSQLLHLGLGDALMLTVLAASASYIAVPAAIRVVIPSASPSVYVGGPLAITFPFNVTLGLPLYLNVLQRFYL